MGTREAAETAALEAWFKEGESMAGPTGGAKVAIIDPRDIVRFSVTVTLDIEGEVLPPMEAMKVQATQMIRLFLNVMQTQFPHVKFQAGVRHVPDARQLRKYVFVGDVEANLGPLKTALHDEVWIAKMFDAACRHHARQMAETAAVPILDDAPVPSEGPRRGLVLPPGAEAGPDPLPETGDESHETDGPGAGAVAGGHGE